MRRGKSRQFGSEARYQPEAQARDLRRTRSKNRTLGFEALEEKVLMSAGATSPHKGAIAAELARRAEPKLSFPAAGVSAVMNAIYGGMGHEFVELGQREVHNVLAVVNGFETGTLTQFSVPGLAFKTTNLQPLYTGLPHDTLSLNAAGAIILKRKTIELGAIVRGPFTTTPRTTYIVFAINRGAARD